MTEPEDRLDELGVAERERLRTDLAAKQEASDQLADELKAADRVRQPVGALGWLGSPWLAARVFLAAARQGFRDARASLAALVVLPASNVRLNGA